MMKPILPILLLLFLAGLSFAEVYRWVDERGVVYFTDDIMLIPEKYRPAVERIGLPEESVETKMGDQSTPKKKEESYKDRMGRGEDYWKGRVEEWRKKLKSLQEKVESLRIQYNELTERFNNSKSSVERTNLRRERDQIKNEMDQYRIQIEEAKSMLEKKIPEEAQLYKAKPEWVKE